MQADLPPRGLALVVVENGYERLHAAFMLAATAAALGQDVIVFGMGAGVAAFSRDWGGVAGFGEGEAQRARAGVAGLAELRDAVVEMGACLMVCDSGMKAARLHPASLLDGVACVGLPSFMDRAAHARQLVF
ncbi:DsrE family protein [Acetobacter sp. TBRC 12305]|uniref:DsrE family protein n=1 Tax=Acetobacter garciniae TaxID=2817435 RepID=A0A939KLN5_9PROT|nr:DsrE family protein [Acetobacter garciniae]MBO1323635.1 DsrE family protein [Acetobacter garciniae]MBX0343324.1 DsrE family protein [Acetobacter garciniae]